MLFRSPNFAKNCANILLEVSNNYKLSPILEVINSDGSLEDIEIDGYIQSIILICDSSSKEVEEAEIEGLLAIIENAEENEELVPYNFTVRHQNKNSLKEYPYAINEQDFKDGLIEIEFKDLLFLSKSLKIESSNDPFVTTNDNQSQNSLVITNDENLSSMFVYSTETKNTNGFSWCFNNKDTNYIELCFGNSNFITNQKIIFELFSLL